MVVLSVAICTKGGKGKKWPNCKRIRSEVLNWNVQPSCPDNSSK
jgi:hypothetical protein